MRHDTIEKTPAPHDGFDSSLLFSIGRLDTKIIPLMISSDVNEPAGRNIEALFFPLRLDGSCYLRSRRLL